MAKKTKCDDCIHAKCGLRDDTILKKKNALSDKELKKIFVSVTMDDFRFPSNV